MRRRNRICQCVKIADFLTKTKNPRRKNATIKKSQYIFFSLIKWCVAARRKKNMTRYCVQLNKKLLQFSYFRIVRSFQPAFFHRTVSIVAHSNELSRTSRTIEYFQFWNKQLPISSGPRMWFRMANWKSGPFDFLWVGSILSALCMQFYNR